MPNCLHGLTMCSMDFYKDLLSFEILLEIFNVNVVLLVVDCYFLYHIGISDSKHIRVNLMFPTYQCIQEGWF